MFALFDKINFRVRKFTAIIHYSLFILFHRSDDVGKVFNAVLLHHAGKICDDIAASSLVGCRLWGPPGSNTTEATWQQQQQQVRSNICYLNLQVVVGREKREMLEAETLKNNLYTIDLSPLCLFYSSKALLN